MKRGPQYRVDRVEISGNALGAAVRARAALRLRDGEPFAAAKLDADLAAIEDLYRRARFAAARSQVGGRAATGRTGARRSSRCRSASSISEGARTLSCRGARPGQRRGRRGRADSRVSGCSPGGPFFDTQLALDRDAIQLHYANLGYPERHRRRQPGLQRRSAPRAEPSSRSAKGRASSSITC